MLAVPGVCHMACCRAAPGSTCPAASLCPSNLTATLAAPSCVQVMSERLEEHEDPQVRLQLKAFIDAL